MPEENLKQDEMERVCHHAGNCLAESTHNYTDTFVVLGQPWRTALMWNQKRWLQLLRDSSASFIMVLLWSVFSPGMAASTTPPHFIHLARVSNLFGVGFKCYVCGLLPCGEGRLHCSCKPCSDRPSDGKIKQGR